MVGCNRCVHVGEKPQERFNELKREVQLLRDIYEGMEKENPKDANLNSFEEVFEEWKKSRGITKEEERHLLSE